MNIELLPTDREIRELAALKRKQEADEKWNRAIRETEAVRKRYMSEQGHDWFDSCKPDE